MADQTFSRIHQRLQHFVLALDPIGTEQLDAAGATWALISKKVSLAEVGPSFGNQQPQQGHTTSLFYGLDYTFFEDVHDDFDGYVNSVTLSVVAWRGDTGAVTLKRDISTLHDDFEYAALDGAVGDQQLEAALQALSADFLAALANFVRCAVPRSH